MRLFLAVLGLGLLAVVSCQSQYEVVHLTEYMRHGARTTWRNSLNSTLTKQLGVGNLTANGMRMQYVLGTQLRKNYPGIFQDEFNNHDFEIHSSSVFRTIESAASQLMGLYPLGTGDKYTLPDDSHLGLPPFEGASASEFQSEFALPHGIRPLPYNVESPELDTIFFPQMYHFCPSAQKYQTQLLNENMAKHKPLISELDKQVTDLGFDPKKYFGADSYNVDTLSFFFDEAKAHYNYNGEFFPNMTQELLNNLAIDTNLNYAWLFPDEKLQRLVSDGIARKIVAGLENIINNKSTTKFRMFSGHDTGLFANMLRFNMTNEECLLKRIQGETVKKCEDVPEFASTFLYELNKKDNAFFVRTLYNGKPVKICKNNQDGHYCSFNDFKAVMEEKLYYNTPDKIQFCGNPEAVTNLDNENHHTGLKIVIYICCFVLFLVLVAFGWIYFQIRKTVNETDSYKGVIDTNDSPKSNLTLDTVTSTP